MTFDDAFDEVLRHEGGYVDHPDDPGGATRFGITQAVAREHGYTGDMRDLPVERAQLIYRRAYWDRMRCDELPAAARYAAFDAAVNSGIRQATLWLQRACGATADGLIGPKTLAAANAMDGHRLRQKMLTQRLRMMTTLPHWSSFSRGWTRRVCDVMEMP